jgi:hypothetical protein
MTISKQLSRLTYIIYTWDRPIYHVIWIHANLIQKKYNKYSWNEIIELPRSNYLDGGFGCAKK